MQDCFKFVLFDDGTAKLIDVVSGSGHFTIPSSVSGHKVTTIGSKVFWGHGYVTGVTIPDSVVRIEESAFKGAGRLINSGIGKNVTYIGDMAFKGCYTGNNLVISEKVSYIGFRAFGCCEDITKITVDSKNNFYSSDSKGVLFDKKQTTLIQYPLGSMLTSYTIPDGVVSVVDYAFCCCENIETISLPNSIKQIGENSFSNCKNLTDIYFDGNIDEWNEIINQTNVEVPNNCKVHFSEFKISWNLGDCTEVDYLCEGEVISKNIYPIREGYSFIGWYPNVPDIMPAENLTFTATWTPNSYNAVFAANGGSWFDGTIEKNVSTEYDSEIIVPEAPKKQGYIFLGWAPDVGVMDDTNGKIFTAIWLPVTNTRYEVETYTMNATGDYEESAQILTGTTDSIVNAEYKIDEGFKLNTEKSIISGKIAADNSLILKIYIDRKAYSFTTVVDGVYESTEYLYGSIVAEPDSPVKVGYTFTGWSDETPVTMPANDVTLEAEWQVNLYTVSWIIDEFKTETTVEYGSKINTPESPVKKGYEFIDWDKEIPNAMPANDLSFVAQFKCISYISINNNTGSKTINYGETLRLTAITANMPEDAKIYWYVDGIKKGEGETFNVSFESGTKTVEVKLVDADGNVLKNASGNEISDSEEVTVKVGFFQKLISFFKNLFGANRTVVQAFKSVF